MLHRSFCSGSVLVVVVLTGFMFSVFREPKRLIGQHTVSNFPRLNRGLYRFAG